MKAGLGILFTLAAFALSTPAMADDATYVAAALSKQTGTVAFFVGETDDATKSAALAECKGAGADDCEIAISGSNICISLARATSRDRLGLAEGATRAESQSGALSECSKTGAEGCNIHDTYCGPTSLQ